MIPRIDTTTVNPPAVNEPAAVTEPVAPEPAAGGSCWRLTAWFALAAVAVVAMVAGFRSRSGAAYPIELMLRVEALPRSSMKAYSLRLPRAGGLEINVSSLREDEFSVYLVRLDERLQVSSTAQRLIAPFTAERVRGCRRSGWLPAGDYRLTLVNSSRDNGGIDPVMSIYARLDP